MELQIEKKERKKEKQEIAASAASEVGVCVKGSATLRRDDAGKTG